MTYINSDRMYSDLRTKGYYDHPVPSYERDAAKNTRSRLRKVAGRLGFSVSTVLHKDDEGEFIRVQKKEA